MKWERSFEFSVPLSRVWEAFHELGEPAVWNVWDADLHDNAYGGGLQIEVNEVEREGHITWQETFGDDRIEMTATFTETETSTRITLTRAGFGEGDGWIAMNEGRFLGWAQAMNDFGLYLETGVVMGRMHEMRSGIGMFVTDASGSLRVLGVAPGGFAATAGLEAGDIVIRMAGAPVFGQSDLWHLQRLLAPGTEVSVDYYRDGAPRSGRAALTEADWGIVEQPPQPAELS